MLPVSMGPEKMLLGGIPGTLHGSCVGWNASASFEMKVPAVHNTPGKYDVVFVFGAATLAKFNPLSTM
jgi:hypothetical protein